MKILTMTIMGLLTFSIHASEVCEIKQGSAGTNQDKRWTSYANCTDLSLSLKDKVAHVSWQDEEVVGLNGHSLSKVILIKQLMEKGYKIKSDSILIKE